MNRLNIFVDESGDFGNYSPHSPYYVVTMVFHEQNKKIMDHVSKLNYELNNLHYSNPSIHTEPLIRKEGEYGFMSPNERRNIFSKLYYFAINCELTYKTFIYNKKECDSSLNLQSKMAKDMSMFMKEHLSYFQTFDEIELYYDNGQHQITSLLNALLAMSINNYVIKKVLPSDYKLFQVADMICTLELINHKISSQDLTRSEKLIFHSKKKFKKDFIKKLKTKILK